MLKAPPGTRPLMVTLPFTVQTYDIDFAPFENIVAFLEAVEEFGRN